MENLKHLKHWKREQGKDGWVWRYHRHTLKWGQIRGTVDDTGQTPDELEEIAHELREKKKAKRQAKGSLTFRFYVEEYRKTDRSGHTKTSILDDMIADFGDKEMGPDVEDAFDDFMERAATRPKLVWKRIGGGVLTRQPVSSGAKLSSATLQAYRRYFKCVCMFALRARREIRLPPDKNPAAAIRVGKPSRRVRELDAGHLSRYEEILGNEYPSFLPLFWYATTVPIRPNDQLSLNISQIEEVNWLIPYVPRKTNSTSGARALPPIIGKASSAILARINDDPEECDTVFWSYGFETMHEDTSRRYAISYNRLNGVHDRVRAWAEIPDLRWYDFRKYADAYLLSLGFRSYDIRVMAGWSGSRGDDEGMVDVYNPRSRHLFGMRVKAVYSEAVERAKKQNGLSMDALISGTM